MRYLYVIWSITTFALLFLALFPLFFLFSFLGNWGRKAIWVTLRAWGFVWFFIIGMWVKIKYLQKPNKKKNYIVVANHSSYIDTPFLFRAIPFFVRPLAKADLAKIPLFGLLYRQMAILVDRNDFKSKAQSVQQLRRSLNREGSIFIFPEGTFNETGNPLKSFYDGAFRLALKTGTPILPVVFPDAVQRWHYKGFWCWSPGIIQAIFLPEIAVDNFAKNDIQGLKQKVFGAMWKVKKGEANSN